MSHPHARDPPDRSDGASTGHGNDGKPNGHGSTGDGNSGKPNGHGSTGTSGGHPGARDYDRAPLVVTWETSQACDLACDHCRAEADPERHPEELSTGEATELFEEVARFEPNPFLVLSGGDPLQRPDLFELLSAAVDVGVTPSVTPATTPRLTESVVERFAEVGVGRMALSVDGATAERHDAFRGEEGTFEIAMQAAERAREVGLSIQLNTTVTAETVADLPAIADLAEELGAAMWEVFFLVPVGRGDELAQLSPERAREVMEWLYRRGREAPYRLITVEAPFYRRVAHGVQLAEGESPRGVGSTGAGNGFVFVSHTGEIYPSGFLPLSAGNVREESLVERYRESEIFRRLRDRSSFEGPCGECSFLESCGGSRSRAFAATGNPVGSDPLCPWVANAD